MFSLSLRERILVTAILSVVLLGVAVQHWRDARRECLAALPAAVTQSGVPAADSPHYSLVRSAARHPSP